MAKGSTPAADAPPAGGRASARKATQVQTAAEQEEAAAERGPTKRVVLKRERVIVLPEGVTFGELRDAKDERALKKLIGSEVDGWVVVGEFEGASKEKAIEVHTGPAGHPDSKVGAFKAPTASAWAGGVLMKAPPKPLVEREALA